LTIIKQPNTYHYDRANRLVKSDYSNPTENRGMFSLFGLASGVKTTTGDFKDNTIAYDANGNFLNMNRNMGATQSAKNLSYSYCSVTNCFYNTNSEGSSKFM
jgi:hypothetical protein